MNMLLEGVDCFDRAGNFSNSIKMKLKRLARDAASRRLPFTARLQFCIQNPSGLCWFATAVAVTRALSMHCPQLKAACDLHILNHNVKGISADELADFAHTLNPLWEREYWDDVSMGVDALFSHCNVGSLLTQHMVIHHVCDFCTGDNSTMVDLQEPTSQPRSRLIIFPGKNVKVLAVDVGEALVKDVDMGLLEGRDQRLKCNECGRLVEPRKIAKPSVAVGDLPTILIVRFDRSRATNNALLLSYVANIPLDFSSAAGEYQLIATAHLDTLAAVGNHYYCFIRHLDGKWLKVDSGGSETPASVNEVDVSVVLAAGSRLVEAYYLLAPQVPHSASVATVSARTDNNSQGPHGPSSDPFGGSRETLDVGPLSVVQCSQSRQESSRSCCVARTMNLIGKDEASGGSRARTGCSSALTLSDPSLGNRRLTPSSYQYAMTPNNSIAERKLLVGYESRTLQYASIKNKFSP